MFCTNCDGDHTRVQHRTVTTTSPDESFLARAARRASSLTCGDIPASVREAALAQRAGTLGAAVWTTTHPVGRRLTETTHWFDGVVGFFETETVESVTGRSEIRP